jgi:hypothetical protein
MSLAPTAHGSVAVSLSVVYGSLRRSSWAALALRTPDIYVVRVAALEGR